MGTDTRLPFDQAVMAARAWRRSGMAWTEIGKRLGYGHNRLRQAIKAEREAALNAVMGFDSGTRALAGAFSALQQSDESR